MKPKEVQQLAHRGEKEGRVSYWLQPTQYDANKFREAWERIGRGDGVSSKFASCPSNVFGLPYCQIGLALGSFSEGAHVNSTLKIQSPEAIPLIEKIRAELKKRAEAKAKRMLLKRPKKLAKRYV